MKKLISILITVSSLAMPVFAAEQVSDNTARGIILKKEELKGKEVTVDVAMVSRARVDAKKAEAIGTILFVVHTWDKKNDMRGGPILVAVPKEDADSFAKRYGTTVDLDGRRPRKDLDTKTLRAPLVVLPKGGIVMLDPSGKVAEAVKNGKAEAYEAAAEEGNRSADDKPGDRRGPGPRRDR